MKNNKEPSHKWLKKAEDICDLNQGVAAHLPVTVESEAIAVLDWLLGYEIKTHIGGSDNVIICDGSYYWESDNDGDQPMDGKDIYNLYKQSKK